MWRDASWGTYVIDESDCTPTGCLFGQSIKEKTGQYDKEVDDEVWLQCSPTCLWTRAIDECTDKYIDMCIDVRIDTCIVTIGMVHRHAYRHVDLCLDTHIPDWLQPQPSLPNEHMPVHMSIHMSVCKSKRMSCTAQRHERGHSL